MIIISKVTENDSAHAKFLHTATGTRCNCTTFSDSNETRISREILVQFLSGDFSQLNGQNVVSLDGVKTDSIDCELFSDHSSLVIL